MLVGGVPVLMVQGVGVMVCLCIVRSCLGLMIWLGDCRWVEAVCGDIEPDGDQAEPDEG